MPITFAGLAVTLPESLRSRSPESWVTFPESPVTFDRNTQQGKLAAALTSPTPALTFIPLVMASPTAQPLAVQTRELRIELRRGAIVATVIWPISAAAECAIWLREVLR